MFRRLLFLLTAIILSLATTVGQDVEISRRKPTPKQPASTQENLSRLSDDKLRDKATAYYENKDYKNAFKYYQELANRGDVEAQYYLGNMYRSGEGVKKNYSTAVDLYYKSAEKGYAKAQFSLGLAYLHGEGVPQSESVGIKWIQKAARQGEYFSKTFLEVNGYSW